MKSTEFSRICSAVGEGKPMAIEHSITHQHGKVVACDKSSFEVLTSSGEGERLQHWERYNCEKD